MKRCVSLALLAVLFAGTSAVLAQEAVTIKLKEAGKGETTLTEKTETTNVVTKLADANGKELFGKTDAITETSTFKETILEQTGKKATKLEREYTKAELKVGGMAKKVPYEGKTVVIEKKGDKYIFTIKGGEELKGEDASLLDKEFNKNSGDKSDLEKLMLPKGAVKPNEEWKLDMAAVLKEMMKDGEVEVDTAKATGTGKLVKVYKKDGLQFGEMKYAMTLPLKSIGKGAQQLKVADGSKGVIDLTMDVCIDGTAETGQMKSKMEVNASATLPQGTLTLKITSDTQEVRKELKK